MKFVRIFKAEAANPQTGEIVTGLRVETDTKHVYKLLNTIEELKDAGTPSEVLGKLKLVEGQYGRFAQLPRYKELEVVTW